MTLKQRRGREGLISSRKVKTNLLAAVLILTVIPPQVPVSRDVVEHLFFLISQKLEEGDEVSSSCDPPFIYTTKHFYISDGYRCCSLRKNSCNCCIRERFASSLRSASSSCTHPTYRQNSTPSGWRNSVRATNHFDRRGLENIFDAYLAGKGWSTSVLMCFI